MVTSAAVNTVAGNAYLRYASDGTTQSGYAVNTVYRAIEFAVDEMTQAIQIGYPRVYLRDDLIPFLTDVRDDPNVSPENELYDETADAALDKFSWELGQLLEAGGEMDPAWLELLDYQQLKSARLPMALENAIALGRPLHKDILHWYDTRLSAAEQTLPVADYARRSLEKVITTGQPLKGTYQGFDVDNTPALELLHREDEHAAIEILQGILRQNIARNEPLDTKALAYLVQWDADEAQPIAQEQLTKEIARNVPLDATLLAMVINDDASIAAEILEARISDVIRRGDASDSSKILNNTIVMTPPASVSPGTPEPTTLNGAIDLLHKLDPNAKKRIAVLYVNDLITRKGPLPAPDPALLAYLNTHSPADYANLLVKSLRASNARNVYDSERVSALKAVDPAAAASLTLEYLQLSLARSGKVDTQALDALAEIDQRAAEEFAKAALADALSRGVRIATDLSASPLPAAPATDTGNFTLTLQALNGWNSTAAAEWAASFKLLAAGKPMADIKAAFTAGQNASLLSWTTVMQKLLGTDGAADDVPPVYVDLDVDLETALQLVFMGRAQQLEKQLRDQIESVQAKNDLMGRMNDALGVLNKVQELVVSDAKATDPIKDKTGGKLTAALITEVTNSLKAAGITPFAKGFSGDLTKGELAGAIQQVKAQIDSLGNNQQTEMIRLQSLTTKRNECYEIITNQMSKMSSINEKIMGNMR